MFEELSERVISEIPQLAKIQEKAVVTLFDH